MQPRSPPTPIALELHHPEGMTENSPAFQRWVCVTPGICPEGTAEAATLSRPFGTWRRVAVAPALKRWAIIACPYGTGAEPQLFDGQNYPLRSGIGIRLRVTAPSRIYAAEASSRKPQRRDGRREKRLRARAQSDHHSVTCHPMAQTGLSLRPSRLCGFLAHPSIAGIQLSSTNQTYAN
jgi:hypothetical protein